MKWVQKLAEPTTLATYRQAQPEGSWDEMRNDPFHEGQQAYLDIKHTLVRGQRGICAYCEIKLADNLEPETIYRKRHEQRIEHFHPKDDHSGDMNWALHWPNLWAVCLGGSQPPPEGFPVDPNRYLPPLPENLSCDAFKDHQIKTGKLPANPEGWVLAPNEVPAFPLLFQYAPNGTPEPHLTNCASITLPNNCYPDTATLVAKTIEHFNLGCTRLNRNRSIAKAQLEKLIQKARERAPGAEPQVVLLGLARRLFSIDADSSWPEFFSLIRGRLGIPAEDHLKAIHYGEAPPANNSLTP